MSFTKNDQAVVLNRESLQYLANCIRLVHSLPDLLNDVLPSQTTTYSSYKVAELLNTLNTDLQNYVNNALGNLSHLKKEIVSIAPTDNSADEDTIYLVQDASGGYEQYLKINGVVTSLGSTSAINNVYTKTESDGKFALLSTLNSLITVVGGLNDLTTTDKTSIVNAINELKTDLTSIISHTSDINIHITTAERTKWNEVDNKVNKTDITTTIDTSSTDSEIATAKAVNDLLQTESPGNLTIPLNEDLDNLIYNRTRVWMNSQTVQIATFTNMPSGHFTECAVIFIPYENATSDYGEQIFVGNNNRIFIRNKVKTTWTAWRRVCTTSSVADVPKTNIKLNNGFTGVVSYEVKNGVCYVNLDAFKSEKTGQDLIVSETLLPKPSIGTVTSTVHFDRDETKTGMVYIAPVMDNRLKMHCYRANTDGWCTFSYPVAES